MPSITYDPVSEGVATPNLPRGQPGSFSSAPGQALEQLGEQGSQLAATMNRVEYMRTQYDEMSRASALAGQARIDFTKRFHELTTDPTYTSGTGDGFTDKFLGEINNYTSSGEEQFTNPRAKAAFKEHMSTIAATFAGHAINWQYDQAQVYREGNIQDGIRGSVDAISRDPTQFQGALEQTLKDIDGIPGEVNPLAPQNKQRLKNQVIQQFTEAAGLQYARSHPLETRNAILGTTPQVREATPQGLIVDAVTASSDAKKAGLDPNTALAVARIESQSFNPMDKNPQSSAMGLFGMIDDTWREQGGTPENRTDPRAQAKFGVQNLARNTRALKDSLGRQPTPGEVYSTQWGLGFAGALAKLPGNTPAVQVFAKAGYKNPEAAAVANGVQTMNASQLRSHFESVMRANMVQTAGYANQPAPDEAPQQNQPEPDWLKYASPALRQSLLTHAEAQLRRDDSGERANLRQSFSDTVAALTNGQMPQETWDPSRSLRVFGTEEGAQLNNQMLQAQVYGNAKAQLNTADPQQMQNIISAADDRLGAHSPGSLGYAHALAYSQSLRAAAIDINNRRVADQVGEDQRTLGLTKPLDLSSPEFLSGPLQARYQQAAELQRTWGMRDYKPLSESEAGQLSEFFAKGQPSDVVKYMATMRTMAGQHSEWYTALMQQIAPKQPLVAAAGSVAPYDPQMAQAILVGSGMMKDEKMLGVMAEAPLFQQWWNTNKGQAFGSLVENSQLNLNAAKAAYAALLPADKRNSKTVDQDTMKMVADRIAPVVEFNGPTLAPPGMTQDSFNRAVAERYDGALRKAGYDPKEWRMHLMRMVPLPHADGVYQVFAGTQPLQSAVINFDAPPDINVPLPPPPVETPQEFATKQKKNAPFGPQARYARGR